ncbi:MAG TPA: DUF4259 domain-containing protein [Micromonospora sp.]
MGAWGSGPFDNDTAADWCGDLEDADPAERPALVERALRAVLEEDGYLDSDLANEAIVAATLVAAELPGGPVVDSAYAPDFVRAGGRMDLPAGLPALALRALDRITTGQDSEWRDLWTDAGSIDGSIAGLAPIRAALAAAA